MSRCLAPQLSALVTAQPTLHPCAAVPLTGRQQHRHRYRGRQRPPQAAATTCSPADVNISSIQDGTYSVQGTLVTSLPLDRVWSVITDYEGLSRVYSTVERCRVWHQAGTPCVEQDTRWSFLVFSGTFTTHLKMHEERQANRLIFTLNKPDLFMRNFEGRWQLAPHASGGCHITHQLTVQPSLAPPSFLNVMTENIFTQQVEGLLADLRTELERLH